MDAQAKRRIAVVGGGISGIAAAHMLQHDHDVTLFEASPRLGGHAHAVQVDDGGATPLNLDMAFLVYNDLHYPRFVEFLDSLGVRENTRPAEMSTCFADYDKDFHYTLGRGLSSLFEQRATLCSRPFARIVRDLLAFRRRAYRDIVGNRLGPEITLGEYLKDYSSHFRDNFVVPLTVAIWSIPSGDVLAYPAAAILRFFYNHRLLHGHSGDAWRTFNGSSARYVDAFQAQFRGRIALGTAGTIKTVIRSSRGVEIVTARGREHFDEVVMATAPDLALRLLAFPTPAERRLLGAWRYEPNTVTLHTDAQMVHQDRRLWASWNVTTRGGKMRVTYNLNRVQCPEACRDYFVTLGGDIPAAKIIEQATFRHPIFDAASVATQQELRAIAGDNATYFCGAYLGHGFHEDGVASAIDVVRARRSAQGAQARQAA